MNFSEVLAHVLRITSRPDKAVDAALAINKAVSYCTFLGNFRADLVESSLAIDPNLYGDTISIAPLTRFRKFTYVKPTAQRYYLNKVHESKIFTPKNNIQPNSYYVAGTSMTYVLAELTAILEVGYLTYPTPLDSVTNTAHWMLDQIPYAIIDLASAYVFTTIGDDASARKYEISGLDLFKALRRDLALED